MRSSRLFRLVWRLNGVLLLLTFAAVGGLALVAVVSSALGDRTERRTPPAAVVPSTGEKLFFGSIETIDGSRFVALPLAVRHPYVKFSSGPSESNVTRNLLFFDAASGAAHWLRPDHRGLILQHELLRESGAVQHRWSTTPDAAADPVRWIRYELVLADTNGDGKIDADDARTIAVSGAEGKDLTAVLEDVDEVLGYASPERGILVVFFRKGDASFAGEIALTQRKLVRTTALPKS